MTPKKFVVILAILLVSTLSAWRALAVFVSTQSLSLAVWLVAWFSLSAGLALCWLAILRIFHYAQNRFSRQHWLTTGLGVILGSLTAWLLTTPEGLSRVTLELYAENTWSPDIFAATWTSNDQDWHVPFNLPVGTAMPASLEVVAQGQDPTANEVLLVKATWPDGRAISPAEFQADAGWDQREISWGAYQNQPVWISQQSQPATLRWTGPAAGPLTLAFAEHHQAGQVMIRWNGFEQIFDLYTPALGFKGITLPAGAPVVWRADLPLRAFLAKEIGLSIQPDPGGNFAAVIKKINLRGIPGYQGEEFSGEKLLNLFRVDTGSAALVEEGVKFTPSSSDKSPRITLVNPVSIPLAWVTVMPWLENGLIVLYGAIGGGLVLGGLARWLQPGPLANLNLAACSLLLTLGLAEGALRFYLPPADKYYVRHPNIHSVFNPYPGTMPGISGESHFITNSEGMRASEFSPDDDYRILVFGGSTAECLYLDQSEAWPQLIQDRLNRNDKHLSVWVGNVGKSGNTSREHVLQFRHLLAQYPHIDTAVLLVGGNDLNLRLARGDGYSPDYLAQPGILSQVMRDAFRVLPQYDPNIPYYRRTAIGRLLATLRQSQTELNTTAAIEVEDDVGKIYNNRRKERKNAPLQEALPDLTSGLGEYSSNLNTIIDLAQAHRVRLILLTQPSMYRPDLTPAEKDLLWFGWSSGRKFYYSVEAMAEGMAKYNQKLLEICRQRQVECLDLAPALPKDTTVFYDDLHFNENGAAQVAKIVADYLLGRLPFVTTVSN
ncbi:MAG: hypothetical protein KJ077_32465 [Anaerolineae bacterium]|nr:hypothetical protein [Anaerolineae bacterium]